MTRPRSVHRYAIWTVLDVAGASVAATLAAHASWSFALVLSAVSVGLFASGSVFMVHAAYHLGRQHGLEYAFRRLLSSDEDKP